MRSILGCTRDTSAEAMRDRHKLSQIKAYVKVAADTSNAATPSIALDRGVDVSNSDQTFFRDWSFNTFLGRIEYLERHKKKKKKTRRKIK